MNVNGELREDGSRYWKVDGEFHRIDGPAVIYPDGSEYWIQHDEYHRIDGPAQVLADGSKVWFQKGILHHLNGPAVIYADGRETWIINNVIITTKVNIWINENNIGHWEQWTDADKLMFRMKFE